jgi:hypothetical protein
MKFLLDSSAAKCNPDDLIAGQLVTPLSNYCVTEGVFAVDNGGFSRFDANAFRRLLIKCEPVRERCLFVALPDVVGSARRTLEMFDIWSPRLEGWRRALVAQDGIEDLSIPWGDINAVFIGGGTTWKESQAAVDVIKAAQIAEKHVHVGRVNTIRRFRRFERLGCDTCDGSGVVRFKWMMEAIRRGLQDDQPHLQFGDSVCDVAESASGLGEDSADGGPACSVC